LNWIDTPLLVYAAIPGHPGRATVEDDLRHGAWGSSVLVLAELYQVLTRDYAVSSEGAAEVAERLARSPLHWAALDVTQVVAAAAERHRHRLQSADAVLLCLAREDRGTLVSQDRRLLRAAEAQGVAVRNPIAADLAAALARWEEGHLLPKGLVRVLGGVERWLRPQDPSVAERFLDATAHLTSLPA